MNSTSNERDKWLAELKEGDLVAIQRAGWSRRILIEKVTRTTKTLIFCGEKTFNRKRGYTPGEGYARSSIWPVTDEKKEQARNQELESWFSGLRPTIKQIEVMKKALDSAQEAM